MTIQKPYNCYYFYGVSAVITNTMTYLTPPLAANPPHYFDLAVFPGFILLFLFLFYYIAYFDFTFLLHFLSRILYYILCYSPSTTLFSIEIRLSLKHHYSSIMSATVARAFTPLRTLGFGSALRAASRPAAFNVARNHFNATRSFSNSSICM